MKWLPTILFKQLTSTAERKGLSMGYTVNLDSAKRSLIYAKVSVALFSQANVSKHIEQKYVNGLVLPHLHSFFGWSTSSVTSCFNNSSYLTHLLRGLRQQKQDSSEKTAYQNKIKGLYAIGQTQQSTREGYSCKRLAITSMYRLELILQAEFSITSIRLHSSFADGIPTNQQTGEKKSPQGQTCDLL